MRTSLRTVFVASEAQKLCQKRRGNFSKRAQRQFVCNLLGFFLVDASATHVCVAILPASRLLPEFRGFLFSFRVIIRESCATSSARRPPAAVPTSFEQLF